MSVYDRATSAVDSGSKKGVFLLYIAKAEKYYGVTRTRAVYERAIEALSDSDAKDVCLMYAEMERKLGEIDRSRAIYVHGSQFCDPRTVVKFWHVRELLFDMCLNSN